MHNIYFVYKITILLELFCLGKITAGAILPLAEHKWLK